MTPQKDQNQFNVLKIYLKQFEYLFDNKPNISVLKVGEKFILKKSIDNFLSENSIYFFENNTSRVEQLFKQLIYNIEPIYLNIISDLDNYQTLRNNSFTKLVQIISYFTIKSNNWHSMMHFNLNSNNKTNFLKQIYAHHTNSLKDIEATKFYRDVANLPVDDIISYTLLFSAEYLVRKIESCKIIFLKSTDDAPWFTSDSPVVIKNEIITEKSEIYFSINRTYLAYLYFENSNLKRNKLQNLKTNSIHLVNDQLSWKLQQITMKNAGNNIIF